MGVDWIPCRIEPNVAEEVVARAAKLESERFCADGGWISHELWPFAGKDPLEEWVRGELRNNPMNEGATQRLQSIADLLLLKNNSFRVNVIGDLKIFPLEWRKAAYRTILPSELPAQFRKWVTFRDEVRAGNHRTYLSDVLIYCREVELARYQLEDFGGIKNSEGSSASWAQRPESIAARENLLALPKPTTPRPPKWCCDYIADASARSDRLADLQTRRQQLCKLARDWNEASRRGNWKIADPVIIPEVEDWIGEQLKSDWFDEFTVWIEPWIDGGYGLYRDCDHGIQIRN
jgi:hypothetical protein